MNCNLFGHGSLRGFSRINKFELLTTINSLFNSDYVQFIHNSLEGLGIIYRKRFFDPFTTLWLFLGQIIGGGYSCREALASHIANLLHQNGACCSYSTGGYCRARQRLPLELVKKLFRKTTDNIIRANPREWSWKGKDIKLVDGTSIALENTKSITQVFPSHIKKVSGAPGRPTARVLAVISLSCGAVLDAAIGPSIGKHTSEVALMSKLTGNLKKNDLLIFDGFFTSFYFFTLLVLKGCDFISILPKSLKNYEAKKRLGKGDRILRFYKPKDKKGIWGSIMEHISTPSFIDLREITVRIEIPGFRSKKKTILTSLVEFEKYSKEEIQKLYKARWNIEVDFRLIKQSLNMASLSSKSPEMIEKEFWMHLIAYNFVRAVMLVTAKFSFISIREISFTATLQLMRGLKATDMDLNDKLTVVIRNSQNHKIANRPNRVEPRMVVCGWMKYKSINCSRHEWKKNHSLK